MEHFQNLTLTLAQGIEALDLLIQQSHSWSPVSIGAFGLVLVMGLVLAQFSFLLSCWPCRGIFGKHRLSDDDRDRPDPTAELSDASLDEEEAAPVKAVVKKKKKRGKVLKESVLVS